MIETYTYKNETWVDLYNGSNEEIRSLMDTYKIHPFIAKELLSTTRKPRIELYGDHIYCILHFPAFKHTHTKEINQEVDFIIGKNLLITARYDNIDAFETFKKIIEVKNVLDKDTDEKQHALFTLMLRELYTALNAELDYIEDTIEHITKKIFEGKEKEMVHAISTVGRNLLAFRKATDMHRDVLETLRENGSAFFGKTFEQEMEMIVGEYLKMNTAIKSNTELLRELRETNNSLLTTKQNETIKQLTVMGFFILPLSFIAVLFAMRTEGMPFIENPNSFWIVFGIMILTVIGTFAYTKQKKWLE